MFVCMLNLVVICVQFLEEAMEFYNETFCTMSQPMGIVRTHIILFLSSWYIFDYFSDEKLDDTTEVEIEY